MEVLGYPGKHTFSPHGCRGEEVAKNVLTAQWRCCQNQDQGLGLHPQLRMEDAGVGEGHAGLLALGLHCPLLWVVLVLNDEGMCFGHSVSIIC